jgi:hypothetical protein
VTADGYGGLKSLEEEFACRSYFHPGVITASVHSWCDPSGNRPPFRPEPHGDSCSYFLRPPMDAGEHWTKLPMLSTLDDIWWIRSKRASGTSIGASLYRLAVVPFHLVQQWDGNVA